MIVRIATPDDSADIAAIYAPIVRDTAISFENVPPTPTEMSARIETTLAAFPWLVMEDEGRVVGYAYGSTHRARAAYRWSCEVSAYVGAQARRSGVARTLYRTLLTTLTQLGYATAYAGITLPNEASVGFHEHMGFNPIGVYRKVGFKHGAWHDVGWWDPPLQHLGDAPADPLLFSKHRHLLQLN